jgi:hypothetical protein
VVGDMVVAAHLDDLLFVERAAFTVLGAKLAGPLQPATRKR